MSGPRAPRGIHRSIRWWGQHRRRLRGGNRVRWLQAAEAFRQGRGGHSPDGGAGWAGSRVEAEILSSLLKSRDLEVQESVTQLK